MRSIVDGDLALASAKRYPGRWCHYAECLIQVLRTSGSLSLSANRKITFNEGHGTSLIEAWNYPKDAWPETEVYFAYLLVYLMCFGGELTIDGDARDLVAVLEIVRNYRLVLQVGSKFPDGADISIDDTRRAKGVVNTVANDLFNLAFYLKCPNQWKGKGPRSLRDLRHGIRFYASERDALGYDLVWSAAEFVYYHQPPWHLRGY